MTNWASSTHPPRSLGLPLGHSVRWGCTSAGYTIPGDLSYARVGPALLGGSSRKPSANRGGNGNGRKGGGGGQAKKTAAAATAKNFAKPKGGGVKNANKKRKRPGNASFVIITGKPVDNQSLLAAIRGLRKGTERTPQALSVDHSTLPGGVEAFFAYFEFQADSIKFAALFPTFRHKGSEYATQVTQQAAKPKKSPKASEDRFWVRCNAVPKDKDLITFLCLYGHPVAYQLSHDGAAFTAAFSTLQAAERLATEFRPRISLGLDGAAGEDVILERCDAPQGDTVEVDLPPVYSAPGSGDHLSLFGPAMEGAQINQVKALFSSFDPDVEITRKAGSNSFGVLFSTGTHANLYYKQELHWTTEGVLRRRWRGAPFRIHVQRRRQAAAAAPLLTVVERTRGDQPVPPARWFPLRQFTAGKTVDFPELLSQSRLSKASCFILRDTDREPHKDRLKEGAVTGFAISSEGGLLWLGTTTYGVQFIPEMLGSTAFKIQALPEDERLQWRVYYATLLPLNGRDSLVSNPAARHKRLFPALETIRSMAQELSDSTSTLAGLLGRSLGPASPGPLWQRIALHTGPMQAMASACTYIQSLVVAGRLLSLRQPITDEQVALISSQWGDSAKVQVVFYTSACVILEVASRWGTCTLPNFFHLKALSLLSGFTPNQDGTEVVLSSPSDGGLAVCTFLMQAINYWALPSPGGEGTPPIQLQDGLFSVTVRLKGASFQLEEDLQIFDAYAAAVGVPLEEGSPLGVFFPLFEVRSTSQLPRKHLPPVSDVLGAGCASLPQAVEEKKEEPPLIGGSQEDSRDPDLAELAPHEDEVQPDLAMVIRKYAHLIRENPSLFMPPLEVPPQHQAEVTFALTEAKRSATTEKGDRWCNTPDPLNLVREAGMRGRVPMGADHTASVSKEGLYLLVPMFGPSWTKGQRPPDEFFSPAVSAVDKHFEPVRYKCTPGVHRVFRLVVSGEFPLKRQFPSTRLVGSLLFSYMEWLLVGGKDLPDESWRLDISPDLQLPGSLKDLIASTWDSESFRSAELELQTRFQTSLAEDGKPRYNRDGSIEDTLLGYAAVLEELAPTAFPFPEIVVSTVGTLLSVCGDPPSHAAVTLLVQPSSTVTRLYPCMPPGARETQAMPAAADLPRVGDVGIYYATKDEKAPAHSTVRVMGQDNSGLLVEQIQKLEQAMFRVPNASRRFRVPAVLGAISVTPLPAEVASAAAEKFKGNAVEAV